MNKNGFARLIFTAPLAVALVFSVSACTPAQTESSSNSTEQTVTVPADVQKNMEETMGKFITLANDQGFVAAIYGIPDDKSEVSKKQKKNLDALKSIVSEDESFKTLVADTKTTMKVDDDVANLMSITTPLMLVSTSYDVSGSTKSTIDPSAFEKKDGAWIPTKDGGIGFQNREGVYQGFLAASDHLSFTDDGKKISFASIAKAIKDGKKERSSAYQNTMNAVEVAVNWINENEPKIGTDMRSKKDIMLANVDATGDTTFEVSGSYPDFFITGTDSKTGEIVKYNGTDQYFDSNKDEEDGAPEKTPAFSLFEEYMTAYYMSEDSSKETLDSVVKTLNSNDKLVNAKWEIQNAGKRKIVDVQYEGKDYSFYDVVAINDDPESTDKKATK